MCIRDRDIGKDGFYEIPLPVNMKNMGYESILKYKRSLMILFEANGVNVNSNPKASFYNFSLKRKKSLPWEGRFLSMNRLNDWLKLLSLQTTASGTSLHFLPFGISRILNHADRFEKLGQKLKSPFGGSYYIQCVKQAIPITPIVSLSRRRQIRAAGSSIPIMS